MHKIIDYFDAYSQGNNGKHDRLRHNVLLGSVVTVSQAQASHQTGNFHRFRAGSRFQSPADALHFPACPVWMVCESGGHCRSPECHEGNFSVRISKLRCRPWIPLLPDSHSILPLSEILVLLLSATNIRSTNAYQKMLEKRR